MTVIVQGLAEVQGMLNHVANSVSSDEIDDVLWNMGQEVKISCQEMCDSVVYSSPESPTYTRTTYLRESIYVTTRRRNDRKESHSRGYAMALAVYPASVAQKSYRMAPFVPHNQRNSVRVSTGAYYSDYVEYGGTSGPRPFMRAGADAAKTAVYMAALTGLNAIIAKAKRFRLRDARGRFTKMSK